MKAKKHQLLLLLSIFVAIVIGVFSLHTFVTAQNAGQSIEVSPPSQEVAIDPSGIQVVKATLRNRSNTSLPIKVRIEDFTAKGDQGQIELTADSPYSVASWTKVSPQTFTLAPGEEQEVKATIKAPAGAAGGHFGSFVFSVNSETKDGNVASVAQEIASLFLVKVSGPVEEKMDLTKFVAPTLSEYGPIPFTLSFTNKGNVHVKAYGLINVEDMFGNKVADVVVPATNIFPGAERVLNAQLEKQFLFGKYTADALIYYGAANQSTNSSTTFYVIPYKLICIIVIVLFLLFLLRKRFKKAGKALFGK